MAGATELAFSDFLHGHIICPCAHLKPEFCVTYPALVADTVKPVGKYDRSHTFAIRMPVQYNICIFRPARGVQYQQD